MPPRTAARPGPLVHAAHVVWRGAQIAALGSLAVARIAWLRLRGLSRGRPAARA
jgi:hypothetical protein